MPTKIVYVLVAGYLGGRGGGRDLHRLQPQVQTHGFWPTELTGKIRNFIILFNYANPDSSLQLIWNQELIKMRAVHQTDRNCTYLRLGLLKLPQLFAGIIAYVSDTVIKRT